MFAAFRQRWQPKRRDPTRRPKLRMEDSVSRSIVILKERVESVRKLNFEATPLRLTDVANLRGGGDGRTYA